MAAGSRRGAAAGAITLVVLMVGCTNQAPATKPAPLPQQVYVRVDELLRRHPLQADLRQLDAAADSLRQAAARTTADPGSVASSLSLAALQVDAGGTDREASLLAQRRGEARVRARERAQNGIAEYTASLEYRRLRRLEQRRAELEAVAKGRIAEQERNARVEVLDTVREKVLATGDRYTQLAVKQGALTNNLTSPPPLRPPLLLPGPPTEVLEQQIAELEKGAWDKTKPPSDRARLTLALRKVHEQLDALLALEKQAQADGDAEVARRLAAIRAQSAAEIAAQLAALRAESNLDTRVGAEKTSLEDTLAFEAQTAQAARTLIGAGKDTGTVTLAGATEQAVPSTGGAAGLRAALDRIAKLREQLKTVIRAEVVDSVRDAAVAHNMNVAFIEGNGSGNQGGRVDRTRDFLGWIGLETPARVSLAGGGGGRTQ